ncbi:MAG: TetR/AcrR family transcriptional regulator C-terminal domain-containing protein [Clostridia bacterium]|nr:TetR/AcrR family transcriptional regulator C-terminal domain-containing protein [Clostridia bacterium]
MNIIDTALYYSDGLDRRQIKTKKAIYAAFFDLLKEKDMSKITITELARKADIDRKTFYLHFNSVSDIYNELGTKMVAILKETITGFGKGGLIESSYGLFMTVNEILNEKLELIREIMNNNDFTAFVFSVKDELCNEIIKMYEQADCEDAEKFKFRAEFIASGTVSMYLRWFKGESSLSMDELALLAGSMIIHGISGME